MKTKGITFWEQHVEHFVLGLAAFVALVLVAMQFLGEPNAVTVGRETISPGRVDALLERRAREIDESLERPAQVDLGAAAQPVLPRLQEHLNAPVAPAPMLAVWQPRLPVGTGIEIESGRPYNVANLPTPTDARARQYFDTLAPEAFEQYPDLAATFTRQPYDVTWTSVAVRYDQAAVVRQFSEPGPNGEAAMPLPWHGSRVDFIDVKVDRQELVNGQWSETTLVEPLIGYVSFRKELQGKQVNDALRRDILARAADPAIRSQIIQPPFYPTVTNSWTPPPMPGEMPTQVVAAATPEEQELADKIDNRNNLLRRIENVARDLKAAGCPESAPADPEKPSSPPRSRGGGGGAAPGPDGDLTASGNAGGGAGLRTGSTQTNKARCESLWKARRTLEARLAKLDQDIERLTGQKQEVQEIVIEDKEPDVLDIWVHDLDVEHGKTYRYRVTIEVYNPLFGRRLELIAEQQPLAEQFVLSSQPSEWTEPVTVEPPLRMFLVDARPPAPNAVGSTGLGAATAEVYRFHNGRWWLETFRVQPGDRVGEQRSKGNAGVDYATEWFVLDVVENVGADREDASRGLGATVMLQSLTDAGEIVARAPRDDRVAPERRRLHNEVKLGELSESDAVAAGSGAGGGAGGMN